jgi:hypothetical protein
VFLITLVGIRLLGEANSCTRVLVSNGAVM